MLAYRLAEAGKSVCVLERGKPYPPGSFPRGPRELAKAFWDPSEGLYGMFNVWSFKGIGALVSSGLGGGSLIYANVLLRKPEKWFVKEDLAKGGYEYWPVTLDDLEPALRGRRGDAERAGLPVRGDDAEDAGVPRGRGEARARVHPPSARGHVRQRRRAARGRRADPRGASEPARRAALHLPARRGVRHRLQPRREEHARPQLPLRGEAARRRDLDAPRGALARPAGGRWLRRPLRRARRRRRGPEDRHERPAGAPRAGADLRPARPRRRDARLDVPPPQEPGRLPRAQPAPRHALRRQRRPAHLRARRRPAARRARAAR